MRRFFNLLFILCFVALDSFAQGILPSSLPGWNSKPANPASSENEPRAGGLSAAVLEEYGSTGTQSMAYSRSRQILRAMVYSFQDASGAYGAYSFLRTPEMTKANYSEHSAKTTDQILVLTGNLLLDVTGRNLQRDESLVKLLATDASSHAQQGVYPALPLQLPTKDLIPHTDRYFLGPVALSQFWDAKGASGDWLGFSKGAEAVVAKYRVRGHDETLLLVDYPTPQIGAAQTEKISQELKIDLMGQEKESKAASKTESDYYCRRDGTLVALVAGARSEADANLVLDQIRS